MFRDDHELFDIPIDENGEIVYCFGKVIIPSDETQQPSRELRMHWPKRLIKAYKQVIEFETAKVMKLLVSKHQALLEQLSKWIKKQRNIKERQATLRSKYDAKLIDNTIPLNSIADGVAFVCPNGTVVKYEEESLSETHSVMVLMRFINQVLYAHIVSNKAERIVELCLEKAKRCLKFISTTNQLTYVFKYNDLVAVGKDIAHYLYYLVQQTYLSLDDKSSANLVECAVVGDKINLNEVLIDRTRFRYTYGASRCILTCVSPVFCKEYFQTGKCKDGYICENVHVSKQ